VGSASEAQVRRLEPADADRAARIFARAFAWHEPWGLWAMPDESNREERIFRRFREDLTERFIPAGECWTIDCLTATMWIPPGVSAFAQRRSAADYAQFGAVADAMREGDALISSLKPDVEHWYLDTIATDPDHFGEGLGGRILDHDLAIRDAAGDACALDTHTSDNIAFYERRGFEVIGAGELRGGPPVVMMFRPPR
jgi:ribosomal protein S18 acetylase RimI-like enzyme